MERWGRFILILASLLAFSPAIVSSFHFDDYSLFTGAAVTSSSGWWEVFRLEKTRPLTYLTFWLNYQIGGENPLGYHLVNLGLHLAAVWLAWGIFRRLADDTGGALAAIVFALHPLQTEAVAYVFARATLLAALFCLLCWRDWIDRRFGRSVVWFALAMLAKEEAAAFPLFLMGAEWLAGRRELSISAPWLKAGAAMLGITGLFAARLAYAGSVTPGAGIGVQLGDITPTTYLLTQGRVILKYLTLIVWPAGLNFDRDVALSTGLDPSAIAAWAALIAVCIASVWLARRRPEAYWLLGGLLLLIPTSSVVPLADLMGERRMYLPLLSFSLPIGLLLARIPKWAPLGVAALLAVLTFQRTGVWRTEESLWRDTVEKSPVKVRPKLQLARALGNNTPPDRAEQLQLLEQALQLAPDDPVVAEQRGAFFLQTGSPQAALEEFDRAISLHGRNAQSLANRGVALHVLGRTREATASFREALDLDACNFDALHNLLLTSGRARLPSGATPPELVREGCRFSPEQLRQLRAIGR